MSASPLEDPFPRANAILKKELSNSLESIIYTFEHEAQDKSSMSRQLRLNETLLLSRSKEIGGKVYLCTQNLIQVAADFANGHGKIEKFYECLELLRDELL